MNITTSQEKSEKTKHTEQSTQDFQNKRGNMERHELGHASLIQETERGSERDTEERKYKLKREYWVADLVPWLCASIYMEWARYNIVTTTDKSYHGFNGNTSEGPTKGKIKWMNINIVCDTNTIGKKLNAQTSV